VGLREVDETGVRLRDLPDQFVYAYDLGDGWEHDVEALSPRGGRVGLVSGEGNCPPEDCGGPPGYEELLAAQAGRLQVDEGTADGSGPDAEWLEMLGSRDADVRVFDPEVVDDVVRRAAGVVPEGARLLLKLTADGWPSGPPLKSCLEASPLLWNSAISEHPSSSGRPLSGCSHFQGRSVRVRRLGSRT
jgi:hypothetical protein